MILQLAHDNRSGERLELVVPTYNEEKRINNILSHYGRICDIVLLDDGSDDHTVEMAIQAGATVYQRMLKDIQNEYHFVQYINEESRSGKALWLFADEYIRKEDVIAAEVWLRQKSVVYGRRIEWVYGKRLNVASGVMPRGFRKGYARFNANRVHGALGAREDAEAPSANNTIAINHLSVYKMQTDFGKTGSYVFLEVKSFLAATNPRWRFMRRYFIAPSKMFLLQFTRSCTVGAAIIAYSALLNIVVCLLGLMCWLEQRHFPTPQEVQQLYMQFYRTEEQ